MNSECCVTKDIGVGAALFLEKQAKFAMGALGPELIGEVERRPGACGHGGKGEKAAKCEQPGGFVEAEAGAKLPGGGAENAAAEGRVEGAEAIEFDSYGGLAGGSADGAASAPDGFAGEQNLWKQTG